MAEEWGENDKPAPVDTSWGSGDKEVRTEPPARGLKGWAGDIAGAALRGAVAVPEAAVGLADIPTGGAVGKFLENENGMVGFRPKQAKEAISDIFDSDATKEQNRQFQEADGILEKAKVAIQNPSMVGRAIVESAPSIGSGGVVARGLMGATRLGQMGAKGAAIAGAAGEGVVGAGSSAEQIRQETEDGRLTPTQAGLAGLSGAVTGVIGAASGGLQRRLGIGDVDTMVAQGSKGIARQNASDAATAATNPLVAQQAKSVPRSVIEGALTEGLLEELPQSVSEQLLQNLALGKDWSTDLDAAIVMGALTGGAMGAGAAGYSAATRPTPAPAAGAPAAAPQAPPPAGPAPALPAPVIDVASDGTARTAADRNARLSRIASGDITDVTPVDRAPASIAGLLDTDAVYQGWSNVRDGSDRPAMREQMDYVGRTYAGKVNDNNRGLVERELSSQFKWFRAATPEQRTAVMDQLASVPPATPSEAMGLNPARGPMSAAAALAVDTGVTGGMQQAAQAAQQQSRFDQEEQAALAARAETPVIDYADLDEVDRLYVDSYFDQLDKDTDRFLSMAMEDDDGVPDFGVGSNVSEEDFLRSLGANEQEIQDAIQTARGPSSPQEGARGDVAAASNDTGRPQEGVGPAQATQAQGVSNGPQANQAQQIGAQQAQDRAAQEPAGAAQGGAQPGSNAPAAEAPAARIKRLSDAGAQWTRMPTVERQGLMDRLGDQIKNPAQRRNAHRLSWDAMNGDLRRKIADAIVPANTSGTSANQASVATNSVAQNQAQDGKEITDKQGAKYRLTVTPQAFGAGSTTPNSLMVEVRDPATGDRRGFVDFAILPDGTIQAENAKVAQKYQRRGLSEAMYRAAAEAGYTIVPGRVQTEDGAGMLKALQARGIVQTPAGAVEAAGVSDQLEDALFNERDATASAIENDWMNGNGRRRLTNIERAIHDAVTASTLDADSAAQIIETALENDRPDLAQYAASRAMRAAKSMGTTPGVPQSSPKYGKIKSDLEASKKQALDAASALQEIVNSKQAPQAVAGVNASAYKSAVDEWNAKVQKFNAATPAEQEAMRPAMEAESARIEKARQSAMQQSHAEFKRLQSEQREKEREEKSAKYGAMPIGTRIGIIGHEKDDSAYWEKTGQNEWTRNGIGSEKPTRGSDEMEGERIVSPANTAPNAAAMAVEAAGPTPDIKTITAKQIPDMTDGELQQAIAHYGPTHKSTAKLQKEVQRRAAQEEIAQAAAGRATAAPAAADPSADRWTAATPAQREQILLAAGWKAGSPATTTLKGQDWSVFNAAQRRRLVAGMQENPEGGTGKAPATLAAAAPAAETRKPETPAPGKGETGPSAAQRLQDRIKADVEKAGGKIIGKNAEGLDIREDANGVRSVTRDGVRVQEAVEMRPTRGPDGRVQYAMARTELKPEFMTEAERVADEEKFHINLKKKAHDDQRANDVKLGNGRFVSFEDAKAAAREAIDAGVLRNAPFQYANILDIAPVDWDRMVAAMKEPEQQAVAPQAQSAEARPGVVAVPPAIEAALDADMQAQKARITRLRNAAAADGMTLDEKRAAQTQLKGAEFTLQTMRRTRFDAEDAALKAIEQKDMAPFAEHITFFKTEKALQELLGDADAKRADAPRKLQPGEPGYTLLDARNDLIELRAQESAQGQVADDRLVQRIKRQQALIREMESNGKNDELDAEMQSYENKADVERRPNLKNGPSSANTPVAPPAPQPSGTPSAQARWDVFMPAERRELLRAAGYTDADQARALSGLKWVELSESVRKAVDAAHKKQVSAAAEQPPIDPLGWDAKKLASTYDMAQLQDLYQYVLRNYSNPVVGGGPVENGKATTERFNAEGRKIHAALQQAQTAIYEQAKAKREKGESNQAEMPVAQAPDTTKDVAPKAKHAKKKPSADQTRAKADLMAALADLGDILGKNTRMNIVPEQEQKLLPVLTRLLDAAFRLGYHKFKDSAKFALDQIRTHLGDEAADALTLDHLQGAYIGMAGGKKGADTKRAVIDVEAKSEIESHEATTAEEQAEVDNAEDTGAESTQPGAEPGALEKETQDAGTSIRGAGAAPLEPVAAQDDAGTARGGDAGPRGADGQQGRGAAGSQPDAAGDAAARSGGNGPAGRDPVQAGAGDTGRPRKPGQVSRPARKRGAKASPAELQAEASEEIKQASPANVPGIDFTITDEVELGKGTEGVKFADNLAAIRTLKTIEQENRRATPDEQRTLARYVGWGGLKNAFRVAGAPREGSQGIAKGWESRVAQVEELLTPAELRAARNSTTAAHYTSQAVVQAMWKGVERLGYRGGAVLEPSVGTGNFLGLMPAQLRGASKVFAVEYDSLTARIAQHLYPNQTIVHAGLQDVPLPEGKFALAIGNPPFGKESLYFRHNPALQGKSIHNQFFLQSLHALAPDGVMGMVVSHNLMDAQDQGARMAMAVDAEFLGGIRLPDTAFKENARTEVVTDMLFFRKRSEAERDLARLAADKIRTGKLDDKTIKAFLANSDAKAEEVARVRQQVEALERDMLRWVPSSRQENFAGSGETISVNPYFLDNPGRVVGKMDASGTMNARADLNVVLDDPATMAARLDAAIEALPQRAPVDAVAERTMAQFDQMAEAMRLAVNRAEPGAVRQAPDGRLLVVVEMDDVDASNRKSLLSEIELTANTPFSEEFSLRSDGKWLREENKLDDAGNPIKRLKRDGTPSNLNEKVITAYDNLASIPERDKWGQDRIALVRDMLPLRDAFKRQMVLEASDAPAGMLEDNRARLNRLYEAFTAKHGSLHKRATEKVAMTMPDGALVLALEEVGKDGSTKPAAILSRRVTIPPKPVERVQDAGEAVAVVLAERGSIDLDRVAQLLGTDAKGAEAALSAGDSPRAFFDPETNQWEPADGYLSGMVRRKLLAAKAAGLEANVAALEKVQPEPWDSSQVTPTMGSNWIPEAVYSDFLRHLGFSKGIVLYSPVTNTFTVDTKGQPKAEWATSERGLGTDEIVQRMLNSKPMRVMVPDGEGGLVFDEEGTTETQMKAREIGNEFMEWAFADDDRREDLVQRFNEKFNTRVVRQRDGSHLTLPGKVPDSVIKMRPWQLNAIWRGITDNAVLYDHAVGAGKTFTAIARAMERRRMGLSKKPMIVVPNHLVEQWAADARKLYPGANILAATKDDFEKQRRRRLFARIGAGDYDMVIVGHSSFGFIDIDPATEERYLDEELRIAYAAVKEAEEAAAAAGFSGFGKPMGVAQAEQLVKKLEERLAKVRDNTRDRLLTFEQMGIDDLTVDEAHEFKNLAYTSNLQGVAGMGNKTGSGKAMDLNLKIRSLKERPGTSVAFLTGTPISNSVAEMYLVLRNLVPKELAELGMENFDAWRINYVTAADAYEPTESGSLKEVTRLGREWSNMRSLMELYYTVADAVTLQDMKDDFAKANPGKSFPVPRVRSQLSDEPRDREMVAIKPSEQQREILRDIVSGFNGLPDIKDRKERNAERLRLMDRARKVSLDARAVDPRITVPKGAGKIGAVVDRAFQIYEKTAEDRGTQLIFLDRSVPKAKGDDAVLKAFDKLVADLGRARDAGEAREVANIEEKLQAYNINEINELRAAQAGGWNAYQEIKDQLVAKGVPASEIRFVQEANTDQQKADLFKKVNKGEVRILIGSTPRMGAGTNVQERLVALHHVDVTWKPSDIEQREGRIVRQQNLLLEKYGPEFTVDVIAYATEMTVDAKMWSLNATKLKAINGVRKYDGAFNMEFDDEESAGMAEMAALATGNPLMVERVVLDGDIKKLEMAQRSFNRRVSGIKSQLRKAEMSIEHGPAQAERLRSFAKEMEGQINAVRERSAKRRVTVDGKEYTNDAEALLAANKSIEEQHKKAGSDKARYVVDINGESATSRDRINALIAQSVGDKDFELEVNGKTIIDLSGAVRAIMDLHGDASTRGREFTIPGLKINGMRVDLDVSPSRWRKDASLLSLVLMDRDGVAMYAREHEFDSPVLSGASVRAALTKMLAADFNPGRYSEWADDQDRTVARSKRDLSDLKEQAAKTFPREAELKEKRARLAEVITLLQGTSDASRLDDAKPAAPAADPGEDFAAASGQRTGTPADRAVMGMARAGATGKDILRMIGGASRNMQNRRLAEALVKAGIDPKVTMGGDLGGGDGFRFLAKYSNGTDTITLTEDAANQAEQIFLHEAVHSATIQALNRPGVASLQINALYKHVLNQEAAAGQYGLKNVREFVAEAFTNPEFQAVLKSMPAPRGNALRNAWDAFVRIIRDFLGLTIDPNPGNTVLDEVMRAGPALMRENAALTNRGNANADIAFAGAPDTEAFKRWFGDSKVVDADGKPLVMYHGTPRSFDVFSNQGRMGRDAIYLTPDPEFANRYAGGEWEMGDGSGTPNVMPVYVSATKVFDYQDAAAVDALARHISDYMDGVKDPAHYAEKLKAGDWGMIESPAAQVWIKKNYPDGFYVQEAGVKNIAVFRPEQIKSAIGNRGTYDPDNADISYFGAAEVRSVKDKGLDFLHQNLTHEGTVSLWDKTVGTMRNLAERAPAFKPVFEAAQRFIDDVAMLANDAADFAPRLLPRVDTWRDLKKKPISAEDNKAVARPLFEGTLMWARDVGGKAVLVDDLTKKYANLPTPEKAQILLRAGRLDPQVLRMWQGLPVDQFDSIINSQFDSKMLKPGLVWSDKELSEIFGANAHQIGLYREARKGIDRSLDVTMRTDMLRLLGEDYAAMRDVVLEAPTIGDVRDLLTDVLMADARENPEQADRLLKMHNAVVDRHDQAVQLMAEGYAPLQRFGRYTVDVVDKATGERLYFGMHESAGDSNRMALQMRQLYPDAEVTTGTMSEQAYKLFQGITPESLERFGEILGLDATGDSAKDKAFQAYLQLSKNNHSALKRLIHRKGIDGYSEDVGRVLASFIYSNARLGAGGLNAGTMERAIEAIPKEQGELRDVAMGLRSYISDPQEEGQAVRGMLFAQYLGGSLASAVVNATQPFSVTLPWLSQFGGMRKAASALGRAMRDMGTKGFKYDPELANALRHAEDDGVVSPQEIHQLMAQARGAGTLRSGDGTTLGDARATALNNWERLKVAWGQPFALAEQFNRRSTFIAAFRLAKQEGMKNPAGFARRAVLETQFLYSKANKPRWARGAVGGTLMTFKTYSISYLELLNRTWNAGVPGSPQRAAGRRAVAWSMVMLMLMGGGGGLPFVEDLEDLIDGIGQLMGYNISSKQWRKKAIQDVVGKELGEFLDNGLSGLPGAPIDVSGRLGMGNLIPGTGLFLTKPSRERDLMELAGPAGDLVARGFTGARKVLTGDVAGAALEVSPTAVRNAAKGVDMATSGIYKDTKGYKVIDTTLDEALAKAIGFQPKSVAQVQESNSFMQRSKSFYIQTSSEIKAQWAQALFEKDEAALARVRERLAAWNRNNPDQPIVVKMPDVWKRVREMGKDRTQRIEETAPRALRQQMRDMARENA